MIVNIAVEKCAEKDNTKHVEFVSYDGKYPKLCNGNLILKIDGERVIFDDVHNPKFWISGGNIIFGSGIEMTAYQGEWRINADELPKKFHKYIVEIDKVFNDNVPYGCCGGCCV